MSSRRMTSKSELPVTQVYVTHSQLTCLGGGVASSTGSDMLMPTGVPVATQELSKCVSSLASAELRTPFADVGKTAEHIAQSDQEAAITALRRMGQCQL